MKTFCFSSDGLAEVCKLVHPEEVKVRAVVRPLLIVTILAVLAPLSVQAAPPGQNGGATNAATPGGSGAKAPGGAATVGTGAAPSKGGGGSAGHGSSAGISPGKASAGAASSGAATTGTSSSGATTAGGPAKIGTPPVARPGLAPTKGTGAGGKGTTAGGVESNSTAGPGKTPPGLTAGAVTGGGGSTGASAPAPASVFEVSLPEWKQGYSVWAVQGSEEGAPEISSKDAASVKAPGPGPADILALRGGSNKLAHLPNVSPGKVEIGAADFNRVDRLIARIYDKNRAPLDFARVTLTDGPDHQTQVLRPSDQGILIFHDVAVGPVSVEAVRGALVAKASDEIGKTEAIPEMEVALNVPSTLPGPEAEAASNLAKLRGAEVGAIFLLALVLLVCVTVIILFGMRNPRVRAAVSPWLRRLNIDLEPLDDKDETAVGGGRGTRMGASGPSDPSVCQFCGTRKNPTTGCCACTLVPASVSAAEDRAPAATLSPGPRLVTVDGPARGQIFHLNGESTVGRDAANTIALGGDTAVSRHHARFLSNNGQVEVVDEGSSNGTFVNGTRVTRQSLQPSDEILIGHSRFRFEQ